MNVFIDSLVRVNNEAIDLVQNGQVKRVPLLLRDALHNLSSVLRILETRVAEKSTKSSIEDEDGEDLSRVISIDTTDITPPPSRVEDQDAFSFFNRGLTLRLLDQKIHPTPEKAIALLLRLATVLIYNMGVVEHIEGDHRRALSFYEKAIGLISDGSFCVEDSDIVLVMGLYNNSGHIFASTANRKQASWCFSVIKQCLHEIDLAAYLREDDFSFFIGTNGIFPEYTLSVAPAA